MKVKDPKKQNKDEARRAALPEKRFRWIFRLVACLLPLVLLALLEFLLRLAGYGYSPHFFLQAKVNGQEMFVENQKFSRCYFPPALARTPQPALFAARKPAGTFRIFVLGESAAMGDPEPAFGFSRILEVLLEAKYPAKRFEVINVAVTAINSHVIRQIARDCVSKEGDVWIIYMGNNEVVGPYGAGTVFGSQTAGLGVIRANIALKGTRIGQLLDAVRARFSKSGAPTSWEGMEMFLKQQVRKSDPRMTRVYAHFQRNLEDIIERGKRGGAHVLLSTVPSNLKDCPPFASFHASGLSTTLQTQWEQAYLAAIDLESKTNLEAALESYAKCEKIDRDYAELHYRMARCLARIGNTNSARQHFSVARDLDALRFRADSRINEVISSFGSKHPDGLTLLDTVELFGSSSPDTIAGQEFFHEHVHLNFDGNYLLARALAETCLPEIAAKATGGDIVEKSAEAGSLSLSSLRERGKIPSGLPSASTSHKDSAFPSNSTAWLPRDQCADRLALTDWDRLQIVDEMIRRLEQRPFTQQLDHKLRMAQWQHRREMLQQAIRPDSIEGSVATYERALRLRPNDWVLHENFAKLLQSTGDPPGAEREWRKVLDLMPFCDQAMYSLGNVLDGQGKSAEALGFFDRALRQRPNSFEARNGIGLALSGQGKNEQAIEHYRAALRNKPDFAEARINLGQALAQLGREDEAMAEYRAVLRSNSNNAAAHINLGKALAKRNLVAEAKAEYDAALRAEPDNSVAHYNLANLLASQNDERSLKEFEAAIRADPRFAEAAYNLGLAYASRNRTAEAIAQFQQTVKLRPQWVDAHLNLGVALALSGRYAEAIAEFRETLRLDPANGAAKKLLAQAESLLPRP